MNEQQQLRVMGHMASYSPARSGPHGHLRPDSYQCQAHNSPLLWPNLTSSLTHSLPPKLSSFSPPHHSHHSSLSPFTTSPLSPFTTSPLSPFTTSPDYITIILHLRGLIYSLFLTLSTQPSLKIPPLYLYSSLHVHTPLYFLHQQIQHTPCKSPLYFSSFYFFLPLNIACHVSLLTHCLGYPKFCKSSTNITLLFTSKTTQLLLFVKS